MDEKTNDIIENSNMELIKSSVLEDGDVLLVSIDFGDMSKHRAEEFQIKITKQIRSAVENEKVKIMVVSSKMRFEILKNKGE